MTKRDRIEARGEQRLLRIDIFLNLESKAQELALLARSSDFDDLPDSGLTAEDLVTLACKMYSSRRARTHYWSASMMGEPVWDMLLALYCFSARGEVLSVSGLCQSAGVPPTTALRWLNLMEQKQLIIRNKDNKDGRRIFVSLSAEAKDLMNKYLATIHDDMTD